MPNERDEGLAALQNKDFQTAQAKLEAAIQQDPSDGMAHLFLGGVYHQLGRSLDAVQALTKAGELQPTNAQARYNLGIVLEHLGATDQAQAAYQQAVALQPDYPLAQQGLERTKQAAPAAPAYAPAQPTAYAPNAAQNYAAQPNAAPPAPGYVPPAYQTPVYQSEPTQAAPPYAAQPTQQQPAYAAQPTQQQPAYGQPNYAQPPAYGQPPQPGYGQAMNQPTDLAGNPLPNAQPAYGQPPMGYAPPPGAAGPAGYQGPQWSPQAMQPLTKADAFSLKQALSDWVQILIAPGRFFESEEGATGFSAPISQILVYVLLTSLVALVGNLITGSTAAIVMTLIGIPAGFLMYLLGWLIWAGINHGISRPFGGSGEYSGSFRASVYAAAPFMTLMSLGGLLLMLTMPKTLQTSMAAPQVRVMRAQYSTNRYNQPSFGRPSYGQPSYGLPGGMNGSPNSYNPFGKALGRNPFASPILLLYALIVFAGMIWSIILMVRGMSATQHMTIGAAAGTVVLSIVVMGVVLGVLLFVLGAAAAGIAGAITS